MIQEIIKKLINYYKELIIDSKLLKFTKII